MTEVHTRGVRFQQGHTDDWLAHFIAVGFRQVRPLASGVEGAVYDLGDGTVAKVWGHRRPAELRLWQAFYADLATVELPFATPEILEVQEVRGMAVTVERQLAGIPLQAQLDPQARDLGPAVVETMLGILRALSTVPATPAMRRLSVLDEAEPFRTPGDDFPTALTALLERRTARSIDLLRRRVPDFDRRYAGLRAGLTALDRRPDTVVHGDLFGENVLISATGRPSAVLDFGFLSGAGDARFDAAVTAATMNMYGRTPRRSAKHSPMPSPTNSAAHRTYFGSTAPPTPSPPAPHSPPTAATVTSTGVPANSPLRPSPPRSTSDHTTRLAA